MKKILLLIAVLFAGVTAYSQVNVTFTVDMSAVTASGYFNRAADTVRVAGTFNGWSTTATDLTKGTGADSLKYSVKVAGVAAGTLSYKFLFSTILGPSGLQWENDPNRTSVIGTTDVVLPTVLFNTSITGAPERIVFKVDMSVPIKAGQVVPGTTPVYLSGTMNGWNTTATPMTKGTNDSVYTVLVDSLKSGSIQQFKFVYGSSNYETISNRLYLVPQKDSVVFSAFWNNYDPNIQLKTAAINFKLDMSVMVRAGIYNTSKDSVLLSGSFNSWTTTTDFLNQNAANDSAYNLPHTFTLEPVGNLEPYKFDVKKHSTGIDSVWIDGYERPVHWGGGNRQVVFTGVDRDTSDFYDGIHPDWLIPNGTNLQVTFNVDMTPAMDASKQAVPFNPATDTLYWSSAEPTFAATQHWYRPSGGHIKNVPLHRVSPTGNIYTCTFTVIEPSFNAFEYNYEWVNADGTTWTSEPAALGAEFVYRVRYVGQDVANHFPKNPWTMPTDTWTNTDKKTDQEKDPYTSLTGIKADNFKPVSYSLSQNYPNPFNPSTTIKFSIQKENLVSLKIYNLLGQEVATLVNQVLKAGSYTYNFNASRLSTGVYFYTINSGSFNQTKKMLLLK
jgi:hypothetical protein